MRAILSQLSSDWLSDNYVHVPPPPPPHPHHQHHDRHHHQHHHQHNLVMTIMIFIMINTIAITITITTAPLLFFADSFFVADLLRPGSDIAPPPAPATRKRRRPGRSWVGWYLNMLHLWWPAYYWVDCWCFSFEILNNEIRNWLHYIYCRSWLPSVNYFATFFFTEMWPLEVDAWPTAMPWAELCGKNHVISEYMGINGIFIKFH